jgi:hypothetical protein
MPSASSHRGGSANMRYLLTGTARHSTAQHGRAWDRKGSTAFTRLASLSQCDALLHSVHCTAVEYGVMQYRAVRCNMVRHTATSPLYAFPAPTPSTIRSMLAVQQSRCHDDRLQLQALGRCSAHRLRVSARCTMPLRIILRARTTACRHQQQQMASTSTYELAAACAKAPLIISKEQGRE